MKFIIFFVSFYGFSQLFIPEIIEDKILVGPENVNGHVSELHTVYINKLQTTIQELEMLNKKEQEKIEHLNQHKLKRKGRKQLARALKRKKQIVFEKVVLDSLMEEWQKIASNQQLLSEALEHMNNDSCIQFVTVNGIFHSSEVRIEKLNRDTKIIYQEVIPVEYTPKSSRWVKKKIDRNCRSTNPEDCFVMCLEEIKESYTFTDIHNKVYQKNSCPFDFSFDQKGNQCYKDYEVNGQEQTILLYQLKHHKNHKNLGLIEWNIIQCN